MELMKAPPFVNVSGSHAEGLSMRKPKARFMSHAITWGKRTILQLHNDLGNRQEMIKPLFVEALNINKPIP